MRVGGGGLCPLDPLPGLCPGPAGALGDPNTPCLTRKGTLVTALVLFRHISVESVIYLELRHDQQVQD